MKSYSPVLCLMSLLTALIFVPEGDTRADDIVLTPSADTFILSSNPDNNAGGNSGLTAGRDGASGIRRALIKFDLDSLPSGSVVTSAVVRLSVDRLPRGAVNSSFDIRRLAASWAEGTKTRGARNVGAPATAGEVTWNARFHQSTNWTVAGGLANAAAIASASTLVSNLGFYSWVSADVIADAQFWHDSPGNNFGWILSSQSENVAKTARDFDSREGPNPPQLILGFTPPASNNAPVVSIDSPLNGATFTEPAQVQIEASATDSDGTVTNVAFFSGATLLGNDATGPSYMFATNLSAGSHTLTARATDNEGLTSTSAPVTITVGGAIIPDPIAERIPKGDQTVDVMTVADGMASPLGMGDPDDGSGRLFVYDQDGRIWIVRGTTRDMTPLADLRSRLVTLGAYDERGLLGLALHPDFDTNRKLYTYTSEPRSGTADFVNGLGSGNNHHSVVAEWTINAADSNSVNVASRREILRMDQPQSNHNGGPMRFGPNGYLFIAVGDGGGSHDTGNGHVAGGNGQNSGNVWGTLLRIDIDGTNAPNGQYSAPGDNPFVGTNGLDEAYAYGFRNPFAISIDSANGDIYVADVGQSDIEEINVVTSGGNYGWPVREGAFWFDGAGNVVTAPAGPVPSGLIDPIAQYDHDDGVSIIGGGVYRGSAIPALTGHYVFGDWGSFSSPSGRLFYLDATNAVREFCLGVQNRALGRWIKGWGEDAAGERYVFTSTRLGPSGATGRMLKLVPDPARVGFAGGGASIGSALNIRVQGGSGPYVIQHRPSLDTPLWQDDAYTADTNIAATASRARSFLRTLDTAHQRHIPLSVYLSGEAARPSPIVTAATGLGLFSLSGNTLTFSLSYTGLSGPPQNAHIHGPASVDDTGGVVIDLAPYAGAANALAGTYAGIIVLSNAEKSLIQSGKTYINIHTAANGSGEIRGQIAPVLMQIQLDGDHVRPTPMNTPGAGMGTATLVGDRLTLNLTYGDLNEAATAAHLHGPAGEEDAGAALIDLSSLADGGFSADGSLSGSVTLTPSRLSYVLSGQTYITIHTPTADSGDIRGQLTPRISAIPLSMSLSGLSTRPTPMVNTATGSATAMLSGNDLIYNLQYEGLSGPATAAHLHGPATSAETAGVMVTLEPHNGGSFGSAGTLSGRITLTPDQRADVLSGRTYINLHTAANPSGETRGQLIPVWVESHLGGANERTQPNASTATGIGIHALVQDRLTSVVAYDGLTTAATAAHLHGPASAFQGASALVDMAPLNGGAFSTSGALSGPVTLTPQQLGYLVDGLIYLNIHTSTFIGGEIRGQMLR